MMFKAAAILSLASAALASPQGIYGPPSPPDTSSSSAPAPSASSTSSSSGQILVQVGANGGFAFTPSNFTADAGTLVTFIFGASIPHSVTQSTLDAPCTPAQGGFSSGLTQGNTFSINITDASTPIYFFCEFPAHCGLGMVGAINAPTSGNGTFDAYSNAALAIGANEPTVSNTNFVSGGIAALATAAPEVGTPTVSGAAAPSSGSSSPSGTAGTSGTTSGASSVAVSTMAAFFGAVAAYIGATL
ncbi:hypothetical protein BC629DRAFT_681159 [Irpex lacteus]|nr:hypothetical protein BC629DRAFT_681159 [Irpex lacteus]